MKNATSYKLAYHLNSAAIYNIKTYFENDATTEIDNFHIDEEDIDEKDRMGEVAISVQHEDAYDATQNNQDMPGFISDIGMNLDKSISNSEAKLSRITQMNNTEFLTLVRQRNLKLRFVFDAISHLSRNEEKPYYIFITGDAVTGKAACDIRGTTLHYALSLPVSQGMKNFKDLTADKLNQQRVELIKLKILIIDEVSMVGTNIVEMTNRRLKQIMGTQQDFGGVSILFFGDLYQVRPVAERYPFQPPTSPHKALLPNFWQDNVIMI
ncbi:uncharacterized protein LOC136025781 [Artemia franciscana]|uniref:uncharacterized protein LOC136025781 n=1 Tax=Artemia franciscana TaxID=6661 RepID=UPI0032DB522A